MCQLLYTEFVQSVSAEWLTDSLMRPLLGLCFSVYRASEVSQKEAPWAFRIVHSHPEFKTYYFSAASEQEMKIWMSNIKREMLNANGRSATYG